MISWFSKKCLSTNEEPERSCEAVKSRKRWFALVLVSLSLAVGIGGAELVLWRLDRPSHPHLGWRWSGPPEEMNEFGFRGRRLVRRPDDLLILLVGDSQVTAHSLPFESLPEVLLENHLKKLGFENVRVFSIGSIAYGQDQELLALREFYELYQRKIDLVLLWETPYNDLWNNLFPNQWLEGSQSKPTFALVDGQLSKPTAPLIGGRVLSSFRLWAVMQQLFSSKLKLATSDLAWEKEYLPPAYAPLSTPEAASEVWQKAYDTQLSWMPYEQFDNEKCNYTIGLLPTSPRTTYAMKLMNALLLETQSLAEKHGSRFLAFQVITPTSRLAIQERHQEPRLYSLNGKKYRYSFAHEQANVSQLNQGVNFRTIRCNVEDWRVSFEDWHLNLAANDMVMEELAREVSELLKARNLSARPGVLSASHRRQAGGRQPDHNSTQPLR